MIWKFSDARSRLSELLTRVGTLGPQTIRRRSESFVVMAKEEYDRLVDKKVAFKDWLLGGPRINDLKIPPRFRSGMRESNPRRD